MSFDGGVIAVRRAGLLAVLAALGPVGVSQASENPSLPHVRSGQRPGPQVLYAPAPSAPQLENAPPWRAPPILVSGATAYRDGEFLYQDFLHDDRGAAGVADPSDPTSAGRLQFKAKAGTLTYPTAPVFANNAADLVELRVKPLADATAFRITLNTMLDPQRVAFTVAIGSSPDPRAWPHSAGVTSPAERFLTVHGDHGELLDAASGNVVDPAPQVTVDQERRQLTVLVPHAAWNPGRAVVRLAAGVGLWDPAADRYPAPQASATADAPGGAAASGAALFNLAFRTAEPLPEGPPPGVTIVDTSIASGVNPRWWRELAQAQALADGDVGGFAAQVDFGRLADGVDDDSGIPTTGAIDRVMAGALDLGQGIALDKLCGRQPAHCDGAFPGQLQAYTVYVPPGKPQPPGGYGLTLLLHALNENENEYDGSHYQAQLGDRGTGYLVVTPSSRGPDGDYTDTAEANVFETWADVARHYRLDPGRTTISGFSMGGGGVYRLMTRWPDLFARGAAVGAAALADQTGVIAALRNTPILSWVASGDEGTTPNLQQQAIDNQTALGLDFIFDTFTTGDHLTIPTNDEFGPFATFLGDHRVDRDPPHVTFGLVAAHDFPRAGVVADHAYWASGLRARDPKAASELDARSEAFGLADPVPSALATSPGVLTGGRFGALSYVDRRVTRSAPAPAPVRDRLVVRARNVAAATVDARRARLTCTPELAIDSDGPLALTIACAAPPVRRCSARVVLRLPRVRGRRLVAATVTYRGRAIKHVRGANLRRVVVRRPTRASFSLRVRARADGRRRTTVTLVRRFAACARRR
jgi:dienelactone hydrolase